MNASQQRTSNETAIELLADRRRRTILRHLVEHAGEVVPIEDLVASLSADEGSPKRYSTDFDTQLSIEVYHNHLPRLASAEIVDFDAASQTVLYRPNEEAEELLEVVRETVE